MNNPVILERFNSDHYELLWEIFRNKKYSDFFRRCPPTWGKKDIENFETSTNSQLFLCKIEGIEPLGFAVITNIDWYGLSSQVGLVLIDKFQDEVRGKFKFAFWCMLALAQIVFDKMPLRRMSFKFLKRRNDIETSLQRAGLAKEGETKESCIVDGIMEDEIEYCLYKDHYDMMYKI